MKKKNYQKPSMTVAEFITKDLVLCTSSIGSTMQGILGSYGSGAWDPFGPNDINLD